jgi:hypothetical protein
MLALALLPGHYKAWRNQRAPPTPLDIAAIKARGRKRLTADQATEK